jgi:Terpene cyclase DEP1
MLGGTIYGAYSLGFMNMRIRYLILSIAGFVLPYSQFVPWVLANGLDTRLFVHELFSNRIGGFFGMDVIVSAFVLIPLIFAEGRRLAMKQLWAPVIGTLLVGVSFGLPLFLLMREPHLGSAVEVR